MRSFVLVDESDLNSIASVERRKVKHMKKVETSIAIVTPAAPLEVLPKYESALHKFEVNGDVLTLRKGVEVLAGDFEVVIEEKISGATSATTQAAYALHCAAGISNDMLADVLKRLENRLSKTAVANLKSLSGLIPMVLANGIKTPLTVLKDAVSELKLPSDKNKLAINDKGLLQPSKMSKVGKVLLPMLKAGTVTQAAIRKAKADAKPASITPPKTSKANLLNEGEKAATSALFHAGECVKSLATATFENDERSKMLVHLNAIARHFGQTLADVPKQSTQVAQAAQLSKEAQANAAKK